MSEKPAVQTEQRNAVRLLCSWPITIRLLADPAWQRRRVQIRDVSVAGIGLLSGQPVEAGSRLVLDWSFGPPDRWKTLTARVVHATPQEENFLIGCEFDTPLPDSDLKGILVWDGSRILSFNATGKLD